MNLENPNDAPALPIEALGDSAHWAACIEALCGLAVSPREALAVVEYARGWALDCDWQDGADIGGLPAPALLAGAHRAYDGGMRQIVIDCRASACDCGALDIEHAGGICPAPAIEAMPIEECELGARAYNVLRRAGIDTLGALLDVTAQDCNRWALATDGRLTVGLAGARQIIEAQALVAGWIDDARIEAIEDASEDADYRHTLALTRAPQAGARRIVTTFAPTANPLPLAGATVIGSDAAPTIERMRHTAIYRAPLAVGSDRSIYEQSITASSMAQALDVATREAHTRGIELVALAAGNPQGFGAAILAAGIEAQA